MEDDCCDGEEGDGIDCDGEDGDGIDGMEDDCCDGGCGVEGCEGMLDGEDGDEAGCDWD